MRNPLLAGQSTRWPFAAYAPSVLGPWLGMIASAVLAVPAAVLPWRHWRRLSALPIEQAATVSGIVTAVTGLALGGRWFMAYAWSVADVSADAAVILTKRAIPLTRAQVGSFSALSIFAFILLTPLGWLATYLVVSGVWRAIAGWAEDPFGDPLLTGADAVLRRGWHGARASRARRAREREEGAEVPDRLYTGEWAGLPGADFVVVASRPKPDWTRGTFVITPDRWYTLGEPFEMRLAGRLRTVYPLTAQKTPEVLRKGVAYELPPLVRGLRGM